MICILVFIFCLITNKIYAAHNSDIIKCGPNQIVDDCPMECPSYHCPTDEEQDKVVCSRPSKCPPSRCVCQFNYRFDKNGTCVPTTSCPPFRCDRPNEEHVACPPYCPSDDCSQATPDGACPLPGQILLVVNCSPRCRCIEGYWRKHGVCVPYSQCHTK